MTNKLGDMLREMRDPQLSPARESEIVRVFNEESDRLDVYKSWLPVDKTEVHFINMRARSGVFDIIPLDFQWIYRLTPQSIPDDTETAIQLDVIPQTSSTFVVDPTNSTNINVVYFESRIMIIFGKIQWAADPAGRRAVHINAYDKNDVLVYGATMHSRLPTNILSDTIPFVLTFPLYNYRTTKYLRVTCLQDSGGALNMQYFEAGLFLVR